MSGRRPLSERQVSSPLAFPSSSKLSSTLTSPTRRGPVRVPSDLPSTPRRSLPIHADSPLAYPSSTLSLPPSTPRSERGDIRESTFLDDLQSHSFDPALESDPGQVRKVIWGTNVNIQESMNLFRDFLFRFTPSMRHEADGEDVPYSEQDHQPFYPRYLEQLKTEDSNNFNLDCANLKSYAPANKLYYQLLRFPQEIIPVMDFTVTKVFLDLFEDAEISAQGLVVRPFNLGRSVNMRELNPADIDQLITVKGLMIRSSPIIPDMKKAFFRCSVCEQTMTADIDRGRISEPTVCPGTACQSKNTMRLVHNRSEFSDKQVARMQETPDETPDGQTPYTISLYMYDDLVDVVKPGDRVEVTGIYRAVPVRVNPRRRAVKSQFKTYLDVVHVKRSDKHRIDVDNSIAMSVENRTEFKEGDLILASETPEVERTIVELSQQENLYEVLSRSIAPSIFGLDDVKKGVLLQLFGGTHKFDGKSSSDSPKIRGDVNVLLVGDPGVSKSQLLKYVHKVAPRGIYTSGKGSSAVGLTAYVTRDPDTRQLVLESGALVLSDGGICCIDEFDKMSDHTRSVLHEVMEQQTISVAKAGIITTLNARTSILASANPIRSKFDEKLSVVENINIPPPLLSRFDLLYLVLDKPNERMDRQLAQHILGLYLDDRPSLDGLGIVPLETFAKYIKYARANVHPKITEEAGNAMVDHYVNMRKWGQIGGVSNSNNASSNVVTATTRQLESMIRLSEAHARMRLSPTVDAQDVNEASRLIASAMQKTCIDPLTGRIDMDMITTGLSNKQRTIQSDMRRAVLAKILDMDRTSIRFIELLRQINDNSSKKVTEYELATIIDALSKDGTINVRGQSNAEKVIQKL